LKNPWNLECWENITKPEEGTGEYTSFSLENAVLIRYTISGEYTHLNARLYFLVVHSQLITQSSAFVPKGMGWLNLPAPSEAGK
jgi:hypothetical protein